MHAEGDGSYTIQETGSANDQCVFNDLNVDDAVFSENSGDDLVMQVIGGETITVKDHFRSSSRDIEEIVFADGTVLDLAGISDKVDEDVFFV